MEGWVLLEELVGKFFSLLGFSLDLHGIFLFISSVRGSLTNFLPKPPLHHPSVRDRNKGGKNGSQELNVIVRSNLLQHDRKGDAGVPSALRPSRDSEKWGESEPLTASCGELGSHCSP